MSHGCPRYCAIDKNSLNNCPRAYLKMFYVGVFRSKSKLLRFRMHRKGKAISNKKLTKRTSSTDLVSQASQQLRIWILERSQ